MRFKIGDRVEFISKYEYSGHELKGKTAIIVETRRTVVHLMFEGKQPLSDWFSKIHIKKIPTEKRSVKL